MPDETTPFETIWRTNPAGNEFWSSRDFAKVLGYSDYGNFQSVIESARTACFNSSQRVDDHFVEVTDMVEIGSGAQRPLKTVMMFRHATPLLRLTDEVAALAAKVDSHLKKMGAAL
jgi:DNA-damage-inducible protein D